jgi:hypothetical protein
VAAALEAEERDHRHEQQHCKPRDDCRKGIPPPDLGGCGPPGPTAANSPICVEESSNVLPHPELRVASGTHEVPLKRSMTGVGTDLVARRTIVTPALGSSSVPVGVRAANL